MSFVSSRAESEHGALKPSVLVVEDNFLMAEMLALTLKELGYEVVGPVGDTQSALLILQKRRVDFALLDVNLRGDLITPVATRLVETGVRFVFLTAYGDLDFLPESLRKVPRVVKPVDRMSLSAALQEQLRSRPT